MKKGLGALGFRFEQGLLEGGCGGFAGDLGWSEFHKARKCRAEVIQKCRRSCVPRDQSSRV